MFSGQEVSCKIFVQQFALYKELDHPAPEDLDHRKESGERDGQFTTTGWTQIELLTREGPEVIMATLRIGTADPRYTLPTVSTHGEPLTDLLDTLKAVHAVDGGVLRVVLVAGVVEVPFEDRVERVASTSNVPVLRRNLHGGCHAHTNLYGHI